jgi:carbon-monoxide dehydrogenase small subunit
MPDTPKVAIGFNVNGEARTVQAYPMARLLDLLREDLRLVGTKEGCGEGECGACAVLINGELANSCLVPAMQVEGTSVTTIEGVADQDRLHAVQEAFLSCGGAQCGICTPGMILASIALLRQHSQPGEEDVRMGLAGNLCRCTGYMRIFEAVFQACQKSASGAGR